MLRYTSLVGLMLVSLATPALAESATLRGSPGSMVRQNQVARAQDFTFLQTPSQVERFAEAGYLAPVEGNQDYRLANVSFPFARPALVTFIERLAAQYHEGCGERLVVTSLTRPTSLQPGNAHQLSVHPTGMAVDLRVSERASCRQWLEQTLLSLEKNELLDVTRERNPPHYHVAVFPEAYAAHVDRMLEDSLRTAAMAAREQGAPVQAGAIDRLAASGNGLRQARADAGVPAGEERRWFLLATALMAGAALFDRRRRGRADEDAGA